MKSHYERNKKRIKQCREIHKSERCSYMKGYNLYRNYGITLEQKEAMLQFQNCKCMICGKELVKDMDIVPDHDHSIGKLRDILCRNCNIGLGDFKESKELLQKAIDYLTKWGK